MAFGLKIIIFNLVKLYLKSVKEVDFTQFENEMLQPNENISPSSSDLSSTGNGSNLHSPKQRVGVHHPINLQSGKEEKKGQNGVSKQKEKETMVGNLDLMVSGYMEKKSSKATTPRNVTPKSTSPIELDEKKQSQSTRNEQPKSSPKSSFDQPFDFSKTGSKTMLPPKSSSSGPLTGSKRSSIPQSFDFTTETNLFNTPSPQLNQSSHHKSNGTLSPQSSQSPHILSESPNLSGFKNPPKSPRTRQPKARSNTTTNPTSPSLFSSQLPRHSSQQIQPQKTQNMQQPMLFDFTTNNDFQSPSPSSKPTQQHQQYQYYQQSQPLNQSTRKEQPKKLGITIDSANIRTNHFQKPSQPMQTSQTPRYQQTDLFSSQYQQYSQSMNSMSSIPFQSSQQQPIQQMQPMQSMQQNPQMSQSQSHQKQTIDPPKQKHARRPMHRSRSRSKDRSNEPSESMKKLGEMYDECQKEQQHQQQQFNLSSSFFDVTTFSTSMNTSSGNGSIPLQSENKITVSKKERQTMIFNNPDEILKQGSSMNESPMVDAKESKVMRNRRMYEEKIKKQKEDQKRDFMLRSSVMSGFK